MERVKRRVKDIWIPLPHSVLHFFNPGRNTLTIATKFGRGIMQLSVTDIAMEKQEKGILKTLRTEAARGLFLIWNEQTQLGVDISDPMARRTGHRTTGG